MAWTQSVHRKARGSGSSGGSAALPRSSRQDRESEMRIASPDLEGELVHTDGQKI